MVGAAGHGGQTLITDAARIGGVTDLVVHRLRDVDEPVHLFPVGEATFPALRVVKSSPSTNLPIRPTRLIKSCTKQHVLCREGPWRQSLRRARSTEATRAQPDPTQDSHPVVVLRQQDGQSWSCASRTESLRLLGLLGMLGLLTAGSVRMVRWSSAEAARETQPARRGSTVECDTWTWRATAKHGGLSEGALPAGAAELVSACHSDRSSTRRFALVANDYPVDLAAHRTEYDTRVERRAHGRDISMSIGGIFR